MLSGAGPRRGLGFLPRARVGITPNTDDSLFIDMERIFDAQKRRVAALHDELLIAGVDLAWGRDDFNVPLRGLKARKLSY